MAMIDKMPEREYMAKQRFGPKLFRRVPYGAKFIWGHRKFFSRPKDGFTLRINKMELHGVFKSDGGSDVRDWFDADNRWSGSPTFKTLRGKAV